MKHTLITINVIVIKNNIAFFLMKPKKAEDATDEAECSHIVVDIELH